MAYESDQPGRYEPASLGVFYRAVKLKSSAGDAVTLTVTSGSTTGIVLPLDPGELHTGSTVITAGTVTDVLGYPREPNSGS